MYVPLRTKLFAYAALAAAIFASSAPCCVGAESSSPVASQVDRIFVQWDKPDSPGCSVGVSRGGELLYERGYGMASIELGVRITPASVFHAASVAKTFTAMSIMLLAQRGKLSLDDDVQKYLPEFPKYSGRLTIRHLLSHTGGLRDVFQLQGLGAHTTSASDPNDPFVEILAHQQALNFVPGTEYQYDNGAYLLLATIVKRVSGESLRAFAAENIFGPLGMKDTRFHDDPSEIIPNRASGYSSDDKGLHVAVGADPGGIVGNAGLFTTTQDLLRWAHNWDATRVGDRAMLAAMATPTVLPDGSTTPYGLGLEIGEYRGTRTVGHSGGNAGFVARVVRYQEQKLAVAILCDRDDINVGELANNVADLYLPRNASTNSESHAETPPIPVRPTVEDLASKEGLYRNPRDEQLLRISRADGKLTASIVGRSETWEMTPVSSSRFTFLGGMVSLEFLPNTRGQAQQLRVNDGETPKPFVIQRVSPWAPAPRDLPEFAGEYRSAELGVTYKVLLNNSTLKLQLPGQADVVLQPVLRDTFAGNVVGVIKFYRGTRNGVSGFSINTTGVRGLRFDRATVSTH